MSRLGIRMDRLPPIDRITDSIPASASDELLRSWGYDLVAEYAQIVREAQLDAGDPVLELATGSGRMSAVLTRLGLTVITGDLTGEQLAMAMDRVTPFYLGKFQHLFLDMSMLPFRDHSVNSIVCLNTLHELADPHRCLQELLRIHRSDGTLVLGDFNEAGFTAMQRLHRAVYGNDHRSGSLKTADLKPLLARTYSAIREVVTPLNISYIATRRRT